MGTGVRPRLALRASAFTTCGGSTRSWLVADGVDLKTAQSRTGHSDGRLTINTYVQAISEADRSAADKLGARFLGARATRADRAV